MLLVKGAILHLEETALWLLGLLAGMQVPFTFIYLVDAFIQSDLQLRNRTSNFTVVQVMLPGGRREGIIVNVWKLGCFEGMSTVKYQCQHLK